jgi:hypothetical protein
MGSPIPTELIGAGIVAVLAAALLGYLLQGGCGFILVGGLALLASGLCIGASVWLGWIGLLVSVIVVGLLAAVVGRKLGGNRGAGLIGLLWLGYCCTCLIGYWVGEGVGLLTIALPANVLFWAACYLFSGFLLPIEGGNQRRLAFRSLLTFSLGTNYPYYVQQDRELETRVEGNPYKMFFGGPGIVLTGPDHIAVMTNGRNIQVPDGPGLAFTARFDVIQCLLDLRPQLRAFTVEAHTRDGIAVRVLTFIPFRVHWGGQKPTLGNPFPFLRRAILGIVTGEVVEGQQDQRHRWDELVEIHATRIMRDIVCDYHFDDLCLALGPYAPGTDDIVERYKADEEPFPHDPKQDPRYRIRDELVARVKKEMRPLGIEVIGGGISNLMPLDDEVIAQRIENWRTKWQNRIAMIEAERDAQKAKLVRDARVEVEQKLLTGVSQMLSDSIARGEDMSEELLAATIVATLDQMCDNPKVKELLQPETGQKLAYLRAMGKPLSLPGSPSESGGR